MLSLYSRQVKGRFFPDSGRSLYLYWTANIDSQPDNTKHNWEVGTIKENEVSTENKHNHQQ